MFDLFHRLLLKALSLFLFNIRLLLRVMVADDWVFFVVDVADVLEAAFAVHLLLPLLLVRIHLCSLLLEAVLAADS